MDGYGGSERALRMKRCASGWPGGSGWFRVGGGERRELLQQQTALGFVAGSDQTMRCGANQIRPDYKAMVSKFAVSCGSVGKQPTVGGKKPGGGDTGRELRWSRLWMLAKGMGGEGRLIYERTSRQQKLHLQHPTTSLEKEWPLQAGPKCHG